MTAEIPERDADWDEYFDQITSLATIAYILDAVPMSKRARMIALDRLAADTQKAAEVAAFLAARCREGGDPA